MKVNKNQLRAIIKEEISNIKTKRGSKNLLREGVSGEEEAEAILAWVAVSKAGFFTSVPDRLVDALNDAMDDAEWGTAVNKAKNVFGISAEDVVIRGFNEVVDHIIYDLSMGWQEQGFIALSKPHTVNGREEDGSYARAIRWARSGGLLDEPPGFELDGTTLSYENIIDAAYTWANSMGWYSVEPYGELPVFLRY